MSIFLKSILSIFVVSIFFNLFVFNITLAKNDYQLGVFAKKSGYSTTGVKASLPTAVQLVINVVLSLVGIIFLALTVYAGIKWMTARGNADAVTTAQETLQAAIIGMVVVSMSYAISTLVFNSLVSNIPNDGTQSGGKESCTNDIDCGEGEKCNSMGYCYTEVCSDMVAKCGASCSKPCQIGNTCDSDNDCAWQPVQLKCVANKCAEPKVPTP